MYNILYKGFTIKVNYIPKNGYWHCYTDTMLSTHYYNTVYDYADYFDKSEENCIKRIKTSIDEMIYYRSFGN